MEDFTCLVSVVGYCAHVEVFRSSTNGVGKSCLCCRFIHPGVDDYVPDHPSLLALHEFESGVVCTDSFLYWGPKELEFPNALKGKGAKVKFEVLEHTLFYQDETSHVFKRYKSLANPENYAKQLLKPPHSSRKISYYSRDTIGFPERYKCLPYPTNVDRIPRGFIVVVDVSWYGQKFEEQLTAIESIIYKIRNATLVIAATKRDQCSSESLRRLTEWANKHRITVVETSSKENINIESVFRVIASKVLKKAKISEECVDYSSATGMLLHYTTNVKKQFKSYLNKQVGTSNVPLVKIEKAAEYLKAVDVLGKFGADEIFARYLLEVRDREVRQYVGVSENPDMRMEMLEQFVDDDLMVDLAAHKRVLRSMINYLVSPEDMYINEKSPKHILLPAMSIPQSISLPHISPPFREGLPGSKSSSSSPAVKRIEKSANTSVILPHIYPPSPVLLSSSKSPSSSPVVKHTVDKAHMTTSDSLPEIHLPSSSSPMILRTNNSHSSSPNMKRVEKLRTDTSVTMVTNYVDGIEEESISTKQSVFSQMDTQKGKGGSPPDLQVSLDFEEVYDTSVVSNIPTVSAVRVLSDKDEESKTKQETVTVDDSQSQMKQRAKILHSQLLSLKRPPIKQHSLPEHQNVSGTKQMDTESTSSENQMNRGVQNVPQLDKLDDRFNRRNPPPPPPPPPPISSRPKKTITITKSITEVSNQSHLSPTPPQSQQRRKPPVPLKPNYEKWKLQKLEKPSIDDSTSRRISSIEVTPSVPKPKPTGEVSPKPKPTSEVSPNNPLSIEDSISVPKVKPFGDIANTNMIQNLARHMKPDGIIERDDIQSEKGAVGSLSRLRKNYEQNQLIGGMKSVSLDSVNVPPPSSFQNTGDSNSLDQSNPNSNFRLEALRKKIRDRKLQSVDLPPPSYAPPPPPPLPPLFPSTVNSGPQVPLLSVSKPVSPELTPFSPPNIPIHTPSPPPQSGSDRDSTSPPPPIPFRSAAVDELFSPPSSPSHSHSSQESPIKNPSIITLSSPKKQKSSRKDYLMMFKRKLSTEVKKDKKAKPTYNFVNMRRRPLPPEPGANEPIDHDEDDYENVEETLNIRNRPPHPLPSSVSFPYNENYPFSGPFNPSGHMRVSPSPIHSLPRQLPTPMGFGMSPERIQPIQRHQLPPNRPQRSHSVNYHNNYIEDTTDDQGYERTEDWEISRPSYNNHYHDLEYDYPDLRRGILKLMPRRNKHLPPRNIPVQRQFKSPPPPSPDEVDEYVNMSSNITEYDYENAETIIQSSKDTPLNRLHRHGSMDDIYYNLRYRQDIPLECSRSSSHDIVSPVDEKPALPLKQRHKSFSEADTSTKPIPPDETDQETGQKFQSPEHSLEKIVPKLKPKLPPRTIPRPNWAPQSYPGYLDVI